MSDRTNRDIGHKIATKSPGYTCDCFWCEKGNDGSIRKKKLLSKLLLRETSEIVNNLKLGDHFG